MAWNSCCKFNHFNLIFYSNKIGFKEIEKSRTALRIYVRSTNVEVCVSFLLININNFSNLNHPNIVRFIGIYTSNLREQYIVTEFVSRGSLLDLLRNEKEKIKMDNLIEM